MHVANHYSHNQCHAVNDVFSSIILTLLKTFCMLQVQASAPSALWKYDCSGHIHEYDLPWFLKEICPHVSTNDSIACTETYLNIFSKSTAVVITSCLCITNGLQQSINYIIYWQLHLQPFLQHCTKLWHAHNIFHSAYWTPWNQYCTWLFTGLDLLRHNTRTTAQTVPKSQTSAKPTTVKNTVSRKLRKIFACLINSKNLRSASHI